MTKKTKQSAVSKKLQAAKKHFLAHKKRYITWTIVLICLLLLGTIATLSVIRVQFFLGDELRIIPQNTHQYLESTNRADTAAQVTFSIESAWQCTGNCTIVIENANQTVYTQQYNFERPKDITIPLSIPAQLTGSGSNIYRVKAICQNQPTLLCPGDRQPHKATTSIIHNIALTQTEQQTVNQFEQLSASIDEFRAFDVYLNNLLDFLVRSNNSIQEIQNMQQSTNILRRDIIEGFQLISTITDSWNQKNYEEISIDQLYNLQEQINQSIITTHASIALLQDTANQTYTKRTELNQLARTLTPKIQHLYTEQLTNQHGLLLQNFNEFSSFVNALNANSTINLGQTLQQFTNTLQVLSQDLLTLQQIETQTVTALQKNIDIYQNTTQSLFVPTSAGICQQARQLNTLIDNYNAANSTNVTIQLPPNSIFTDYCSNTTNNLTTIQTPYISLLPQVTFLQSINQPRPIAQLKEHKEICCSPTGCNECTQNAESPVIFLHGHAFSEQVSPETMLQRIRKLQETIETAQLTDLGTLVTSDTLASLPANSLALFNTSFTFAASYYYLTYFDIGTFSAVVQGNDRIENYAIRLHELVSEVKRITGKPKVTIVAHSMGGLVTREYLRIFGAEHIDKIITVNTPHQGVSGRVSQFCDVFGANHECSDMRADSVFMKRLTAYTIPESVNITTITSTGCQMDTTFGDGVVTDAEAFLEGATQLIINGSCTDLFGTNLHTDVMDAQQYPVIIDLLTQELEK